MFFKPRKNRSRDWYWFHMAFLYAFSLISGVATVGFLIESPDDLSGRIGGTLMFLAAALICWKLGQACSKKVAEMRADDDNLA